MLRRWLPRAIGPVLFGVLWWVTDLGQAGTLLGRAKPWPLVVAALINLAIIVVKAWRWREIMFIAIWH